MRFPGEPPRDRFVQSHEKRPWRPYAWGLAGLGLMTVAVGVLNPTSGQQLQLPQTMPVVLREGRAIYVPALQTFPKPVDWTGSQAVVRVKVPPQWVQDQRMVLSLRVRDQQGRRQSSRWTEGQLVETNPNFDPRSGTLTLHLQPTAAEADEHGHTDEGFDPSRIISLALLVSPHGTAPFSSDALQITDQQLHSVPAPSPARVQPLYGKLSQAGPRHPRDLKSGVSRFFAYGDLHRWSEVKPQVSQELHLQRGLPAFRWMGALDLRERRLGPEVYPAMREYLQMAAEAGQDRQIFTLLDGAIPNPRLQRALNSEAARHELVEELRPFIREFGNAKVNGQPVVFDLVNEIHGTPGPEVAKQKLVEELVDTFIQEAPGARLTVGVQNFRELKYWTYLLEKFQGQPVDFVMTFHVYEPMENVPDRRELNIPDSVEVGITEADPARGVAAQVEAAAAKGYDWLLFWQDAQHPYHPTEHRQAIQ